ncbi:type II toxin-antitoxin system HicB family antitoxin [Micromonospora chalcea]|uniref:type II toxin-antitoxin system HicB family antitoxin n=1 Tax=Micromonospora chalcea TaxID=1874 RepID=UPI0033D8F765
MKTYTAKARRSDGWWAISVPEIKGVHSQARRLGQVEAMARDAIALFLDVSPRSFKVQVEPELSEEVVDARLARAELIKAQQRADEATKRALRKLLAANLSVREAADLVGVSPGRVSQLVPSKKTAPSVNAMPKQGSRGKKGSAAATPRQPAGI